MHQDRDGLLHVSHRLQSIEVRMSGATVEGTVALAT